MWTKGCDLRIANKYFWLMVTQAASEIFLYVELMAKFHFSSQVESR